MTFKFLIFTLFTSTLSIANAQSTVLLEACNAIDARIKRMECFSELIRLPSAKPRENNAVDVRDIAVKRAKAAFAALAGAVRSGISYNNYSLAILDPAKEVGVLRQEASGLDAIVFDRLDQSVTAYNDAAIVWRASIFQSQDAGIFSGRILVPERAGLTQIVNRYRLNTTTVLLNTHLPADAAMIKIWREAEVHWKHAFEVADGLPQTSYESYAGPVVCDKWGNPKDINGNPCISK